MAAKLFVARGATHDLGAMVAALAVKIYSSEILQKFEFCQGASLVLDPTRLAQLAGSFQPRQPHRLVQRCEYVTATRFFYCSPAVWLLAIQVHNTLLRSSSSSRLAAKDCCRVRDLNRTDSGPRTVLTRAGTIM